MSYRYGKVSYAIDAVSGILVDSVGGTKANLINKRLKALDKSVCETDSSEINEIREELLSLLALGSVSKERRQHLIAALQLLAVYWPLNDKCLITAEDITEANHVATIEGYLISAKALPGLLASEQMLNPAGLPFNEINRAYFLNEAEKRKLIARDAKAKGRKFGLILGLSLALVATIATVLMVFNVLGVAGVLGLALAAKATFLHVVVPIVSVYEVMILLSMAFGVIPQDKASAIFMGTLVFLPIILPLVALAAPYLLVAGLFAGIGHLIGAEVNRSNGRPAFLSPKTNPVTEYHLFMNKVAEGRVSAKAMFARLDDILNAKHLDKDVKLRVLADCEAELKTSFTNNKQALKSFFLSSDARRGDNPEVCKKMLSTALDVYTELKQTASAKCSNPQETRGHFHSSTTLQEKTVQATRLKDDIANNRAVLFTSLPVTGKLGKIAERLAELERVAPKVMGR